VTQSTYLEDIYNSKISKHQDIEEEYNEFDHRTVLQFNLFEVYPLAVFHLGSVYSFYYNSSRVL